MAEGKAPWPTGDPDGTGPNPWIFRPKGFLVAILCDPAAAERARDRLVGQRICRGRLPRIHERADLGYSRGACR